MRSIIIGGVGAFGVGLNMLIWRYGPGGSAMCALGWGLMFATFVILWHLDLLMVELQKDRKEKGDSTGD